MFAKGRIQKYANLKRIVERKKEKTHGFRVFLLKGRTE